MTLCGVPKDECTGTLLKEGNANLGSKKAHRTAKDARRCWIKWKQRQGYVREGNLLIKEGEPALMMTREMKFGLRLRKGKSGLKGQKASRYMLDRKARRMVI